MADSERTLKINKEIIGSLVDAISGKKGESNYKECFELFQAEVRAMIGQIERAWAEVEMVRAKLKVSEEVKTEIYSRDVENSKKYQATFSEMKDKLEKKDY